MFLDSSYFYVLFLVFILSLIHIVQSHPLKLFSIPQDIYKFLRNPRVYQGHTTLPQESHPSLFSFRTTGITLLLCCPRQYVPNLLFLHVLIFLLVWDFLHTFYLLKSFLSFYFYKYKLSILQRVALPRSTFYFIKPFLSFYLIDHKGEIILL